jgi:hypothetical protein
MDWIKHLLEYIGGEVDAPPPGLSVRLPAWAWGLWWGALLIIIMIFCGQSSKFIYIDF